MAIKVLNERGSSANSIARTLGVTEGAVRYHLRRQAAHAEDGRAGKPHKAAAATRRSRAGVTDRVIRSTRRPADLVHLKVGRSALRTAPPRDFTRSHGGAPERKDRHAPTAGLDPPPPRM